MPPSPTPRPLPPAECTAARCPNTCDAVVIVRTVHARRTIDSGFACPEHHDYTIQGFKDLYPGHSVTIYPLFTMK